MCAKLVSKLLSGNDRDAPQGAGSMGPGMSRALSKALGTLPEQQEHGAHPHHIQLTMTDEVKEHIGALPALATWHGISWISRVAPMNSHRQGRTILTEENW